MAGSPHQPRHGLRHLIKLVVGHLPALLDRLTHAMIQMIVQQHHCNRFQRRFDCGNLRQHINAVPVVVDHTADRPDLPLNPAHPRLDLLLIFRISVHPCRFPLLSPIAHVVIPRAEYYGALYPIRVYIGYVAKPELEHGTARPANTPGRRENTAIHAVRSPPTATMKTTKEDAWDSTYSPRSSRSCSPPY